MCSWIVPKSQIPVQDVDKIDQSSEARRTIVSCGTPPPAQVENFCLQQCLEDQQVIFLDMPRIGWASFSADCSCNHCSQCQLQQMKDDEFDKAAINMIGIHKFEGKIIKVEKPQGWLSEEYAVRPEMVKSILTHLGLTGV